MKNIKQLIFKVRFEVSGVVNYYGNKDGEVPYTKNGKTEWAAKKAAKVLNDNRDFTTDRSIKQMMYSDLLRFQPDAKSVLDVLGDIRLLSRGYMIPSKGVKKNMSIHMTNAVSQKPDLVTVDTLARTQEVLDSKSINYTDVAPFRIQEAEVAVNIAELQSITEKQAGSKEELEALVSQFNEHISNTPGMDSSDLLKIETIRDGRFSSPESGAILSDRVISYLVLDFINRLKRLGRDGVMGRRGNGVIKLDPTSIERESVEIAFKEVESLSEVLQSMEDGSLTYHKFWVVE